MTNEGNTKQGSTSPDSTVPGSTVPGRLAGRVAIVTGASRGLGLTIAQTFAAEGASVAVVARSEVQWDTRLPGTIHETVESITEAGGKAIAVAADLSVPEDVERVVAETRSAFGSVDILINNAALTVPGRPAAANETSVDAATTTKAKPASQTGDKPAGKPSINTKPGGPGSFLNFPLKGFRQHYEIGLFASYRLMQLVLEDMVAAQSGSIVNISSVAGLMPGEGPYETTGVMGVLAYGGNKAALHHLTQAAAVEMQAYGIGVNALLPSEPVVTPGNLVAVPNEPNFASPEDFAEATLQVVLADPNEVNGQILWSEDVLHPELPNRGWLR